MTATTMLIAAAASAVLADDLYEIEVTDDSVNLHLNEPLYLHDEREALPEHRTDRQLRQRHKTLNRKKRIFRP